MRKIAVIGVGLAMLIAQGQTALASEPATVPASTEDPRMLGLTGEHWAAIGLGALAGWAIVHHAFRIPATVAIVGGGAAGSWYWRRRVAMGTRTAALSEPQVRALEARWLAEPAVR
ncbi:MAG: hypothetical protein HQL38_13295 [Alphaproteobacteria bacterium]|nr:hypothetical protein [Alphaproteobacteria bacterium]MBF0374006.1 hypothetical protein [Alphaproteobacteria bacterium]MBF0393647.1 hypothetical protein [Alphaproteobacteria bacterium]